MKRRPELPAGQLDRPLELLLERLPGLRLDPERPVELSGWEFRAPLHLHVLWDPA